MGKLNKLISVLLLAMILFMLSSCDYLSPKSNIENETEVSGDATHSVAVGFSQTGNQVGWRLAQTTSIVGEGEARGYKIVYTDAQEDTEKQITDVEEILKEGVDYLIFDPREYEASAAALQKAKDAKVPVIVVDRAVRGTPGVDYVTLIAPDFSWEAEQVANWLKRAKGGKAKIVEITGTLGSSAMIDRQKGFGQVVDSEPGMEIIASENGNFIRSEAQKAMEKIIQTKPGQFDTIFVHNDDMAIGVLQALKSAGIMPGKDVMVIGIDGQKEAVQAIIDGEMACTVTCSPYYGPIVFDTIEKLIKGEFVEENIIMQNYIIDINNAKEELDKAF